MLKAQDSENKDHGILSQHFMGNRWGTMETVTDFIFLGSKFTADGDRSHEINNAFSLKETYDQPRQHIKNRDINLPTRTVVLEKSLESPLYCKEI